MKLYKIHHDLIADWTAEAWYKIPSDGPVFRERWEYGTSGPGTFLTISSEHHSQAVHREEPLLTMAWGMDVDDERRPRNFDWAEDLFGDSSVHAFWVDFFWAGALIDRVTLLGVDGHRGVIPFPDLDGTVSQFELAVADRIHDLGGYQRDYAPVDLIKRLGFAEARDKTRG